MRSDADLAQRLSESCVKIVLAVLVLSAVTFGIAQRIQNLAVFNSYWVFLKSRADLETLTNNLSEDSCWQKFVESLPDPMRAGETTLAELKRIECTPHHDQMRINARKSIDASSLDPASLEFVTPQKDASASEGWYPLGLDSIEWTLAPLWDDAALDRAGAYSVVARDDVYRWRMQRFHLQQVRGLPLVPARLPDSHALSESNFLRLQVADLNVMNRATRSALSDLDRGTKEFRASLPNSPMDFDLGTAAIAAGLMLVVFMAVLAGYVRVADAHGAFTHRGSIFHVMLGTRFTKFIGFLVLILPASALFALGCATYESLGVIAAPAISELAVFWATLSILRRLLPHLRLFPGSGVPS